jgi:methionyl-tRNA formyltransferase
MNPKILFMGSSEYSLTILKNLTKEFPISLIATQPDKPIGRGKKQEISLIKAGTQELEIPVIQPKTIKDENFLNLIKDHKIDLIVVAAYGKILPKTVLEYPKHGCLNVHASLLPRWRGASPIQAAILHGDKQSGVTIIRMDQGIDTGPILKEKMIEIDPRETSASLAVKLAQLGSELLNEILPDYLDGKIKPVEQSNTGATYTGLVKKADGLLDFKNTAEFIDNQIRAYNPWPICYMMWENRELRIFSAEVAKEKQLKEGQRGISAKYPCVGTQTSDLILKEVQPSGRKRIDGKAFLNGTRYWAN